MNKNPTFTQQPVIFFGVCERAAYVRDGNTNVPKWNILGLKQVVLSPIYPLQFQGYSLALALVDPDPAQRISLRLRDPDGQEVGLLSLTLAGSGEEAPGLSSKSEGHVLMAPLVGVMVVFVPINEPIFLIRRPGLHTLNYFDGTRDNPIGQILFEAFDPPPLTPERVAAIRSDPGASQAIRIRMRCNKCQDISRAYAGLGRFSDLEAQGYVWYEDVPDEFLCRCGATTLNLRYVRRNLHALLGQRTQTEEALEFLPLYERSSLESLRHAFNEVLEKNASNEEAVQQFVANNPILLHQFPALKIFPKPPILTRYKADFAILGPARDLILIEIERPNRRIAKKNGGIAADLQHAFDQVHDWLSKVDEHRLAFLDSLGIEPQLVGAIRAVVIAGRDSGVSADHLRKVKARYRDRVTFLTYDDLLAGLDALVLRFKTL